MYVANISAIIFAIILAVAYNCTNQQLKSMSLKEILKERKPLALGAIAHNADIPMYRLYRWFHGETELTDSELGKLKKSLDNAGNRIDKLSRRVRNELKN